MHDLLQRMHAGIGAPGANDAKGMMGNGRKTALHFRLQARCIRLHLPTGVTRAVVLNACGPANH